MKRIWCIFLILLTSTGYSQDTIVPIDEITYFTKMFSEQDLEDPLNSSIFVDSTIEVSSGVQLRLTLRKETTIWDNGQLRCVRFYNRNTPFGEWKYYEKNGALKFSVLNLEDAYILRWHFDNNNYRSVREYTYAKKGETYECIEENYFPDGRVQSHGARMISHGNPYADFVECGKWTYYFPNGKKESQGKYVDGIKNGKWTFYNAQGDKIRTVIFKNGSIISQKVF